NTPGVAGTVKAPFFDGNGDGFADVDAVGRFVDGSGQPLAIDTPFFIPGKPYGDQDELGRSTAKLFQYLDTSRTLVGAVSGQLLADPDSDAILIALDTLVRDHEDVVARLMDSALKIKAIADAHDKLAAAGKEAKAELPYETPVWDQIAGVVSDMTDHPGLVR